jgi:hypothetical protein
VQLVWADTSSNTADAFNHLSKSSRFIRKITIDFDAQSEEDCRVKGERRHIVEVDFTFIQSLDLELNSAWKIAAPSLHGGGDNNR